MIHVLIAVAIQLCTAAFVAAVFGLDFEGGMLVGASAGMWFFVGREIAQAEYRGIVAFYGGKRENAPWHVGLQSRCWDSKSLMDVVLPSTVVTILYAASTSI